jgi:hypothetical protein
VGVAKQPEHERRDVVSTVHWTWYASALSSTVTVRRGVVSEQRDKLGLFLTGNWEACLPLSIRCRARLVSWRQFVRLLPTT